MKVRFVPQDVVCEIKPGESVMHVAQDAGLYIKSVCKGVPSCAECRVRVIEGEHNVLPPGSEELSLIGTGHFIDRRRLSCQLKCFGDITVDLSEQIAKEKGLIGGRKTKMQQAQNDRIEEARIMRADEFKPKLEGDVDEELSDDEELTHDQAINAPPKERHAHTSRPQQQQQRGPQQPRPPQAGSGGPRPQSQGAPGGGGSAEGSSGDRKKRRRRRGGRGGSSGGGRGGNGGGPLST